ncbi:MAG: hypothetical protein J5U19_13230, partial [Candidatus Methanoperedens sp.]|nr:hypothetical protein [Candidatus Methanoperedens sp.]
PPASHRHVTSPGVGFSSEVAAYPFLMLDFHQLATTSFARRARAIRVLKSFDPVYTLREGQSESIIIRKNPSLIP